ncbi:hypothetical protein FF011L_27880 [Roseimaritima multifibrata]|uniref:Uncharacterized protein n=1 Tax=Roseimaritima multifibrata TaxID=1930274 RepID=A0A517MGK2_9BACT|nr:hypothetical protein FF011L_27880 [Roseimaritima multifibrata]
MILLASYLPIVTRPPVPIVTERLAFSGRWLAIKILDIGARDR